MLEVGDDRKKEHWSCKKQKNFKMNFFYFFDKKRFRKSHVYSKIFKVHDFYKKTNYGDAGGG